MKKISKNKRIYFSWVSSPKLKPTDNNFFFVQFVRSLKNSVIFSRCFTYSNKQSLAKHIWVLLVLLLHTTECISFIGQPTSYDKCEPLQILRTQTQNYWEYLICCFWQGSQIKKNKTLIQDQHEILLITTSKKH